MRQSLFLFQGGSFYTIINTSKERGDGGEERRGEKRKERRGEERRGHEAVSQQESAQWLVLFLIPPISSVQTQTYEIILTLGQAFEVAYQVAVQSRARQYVPPAPLHPEVVETKTSRPVCPSWSSMRRSAVSTGKHNNKDLHASKNLFMWDMLANKCPGYFWQVFFFFCHKQLFLFGPD